MENCADNGFEFDNAEKFPERLLIKGRSQLTVQNISEKCGWKEDLLDRKTKADAKHDEKQAAAAAEAEKKDKAVDDLTNQLGGLDVNKDEEKEKVEEKAEGENKEKAEEAEKPKKEEEKQEDDG